MNRQTFKHFVEKFFNRVRDFLSDGVQTLSISDAQSLDASAFVGYVVSNDGTVTLASEYAQRDDAQIVRRGTKHVETESETRAAQVRDLSAATRAQGRVSIENQADLRFTSNVTDFMQVALEDFDEDVFSYSEHRVRNMKPWKLIEMLSQASPEMSRALFDFLLMCCPGWELEGIGDNDEIFKPADDYLKQCISTLKENYKAPEVLFVRYFMSAFLRGAMSSELVLDQRGREFVDISMIDPETLEHKRVRDDRRGLIWQIFQRQNGQVVDLNIPQVAYIPIHASFGTNKGRPIAKPAVFVCFFLISTLQDLRRVIRQQGYPRIDIAVNIEKLKKLIPQAKMNDASALKKLAEDIVTEVKTVYGALKPDDTYVHTEVVEVNQPVGTLNATSLGVVDGLLKALERMATRALKTMPLLMATTDGVSEANANRQWEIHVAGIKSLQHYGESILEDHFNLALRAKGIRGKARMRFSELRAAELLRDAQVEALNTATARQQYDNGSISADEMAQKSAGKDAADQQKPRDAQTQTPQDVANVNPEPGGNRAALRDLVMSEVFRMTLQDVAEAKSLFEQYAPDSAKDLLNAEVIN